MFDTSRGDNWTSEEDMPDTSRGDILDVRTCLILVGEITGRQRRTCLMLVGEITGRQDMPDTSRGDNWTSGHV